MEIGSWSADSDVCSEWSGVTSCTAEGNVRALRLDNDKLTGSLPEQWSALTGLEALALVNNKLTGTLPRQWSVLTGLTDMLDVSDNMLTGTLPKQWSALTGLQALVLLKNKLTGTLPTQWSTLTTLDEIALGSKQLMGPFPEQWSTLNASKRMKGFDGNLAGRMDFSLDGIPSEGWPAFCSSKPPAPPLLTSSIPSMGEVHHKGDLLYYFHPMKSGGTSVVREHMAQRDPEASTVGLSKLALFPAAEAG